MLEQVKERLNKYNVLYIEKEITNGTQLKSQTGLIINVWNNGNITFQGKRDSQLEKVILKESLKSENVLKNLEYLTDLGKHFYKISEDHGFKENWDLRDHLMNIHSEVSELWEAYRKNQLEEPCDKFPKLELTCEEEEFADILIRTLDYAITRGIDIPEAIRKKSEYNESRPYKHGNKIC